MVNTLTRQSPERSYEAEQPIPAEGAEEFQAQIELPKDDLEKERADAAISRYAQSTVRIRAEASLSGNAFSGN